MSKLKDDKDDDSLASAESATDDVDEVLDRFGLNEAVVKSLLAAVAVLKQSHVFVQERSEMTQHQTAVRAVQRRVPCKVSSFQFYLLFPLL